MKVDTIRKQLTDLRARIRLNGSMRPYADDGRLVRSELFSADQMVQHAKTLAASHKLKPERVPDFLLARLAENEVVLSEVRALVSESVRAGRRVTPAAEWLLDNFYLIEEQIRTIRRHLPREYSRQLPCLADGPSASLPRVYDLALETIAHVDGRVDPEALVSFVTAYQTVSVLKLGELWALPIMLRLALIENLRRLGLLIATDRFDRNKADQWADRMTEAAQKDPKSLILVTADMARSDPPLVGAFVGQLTHRLQEQGPALALPLTWIEQRLSESGWTTKQLLQSESQQQAADQVSVSNSIGSLRFLGAMDWQTFVETTSIVEHILREDIGGIYAEMDFATRDRYRHAIEEIARRSPLAEHEVARAAIQLSRRPAAGKGEKDRASHVGFYLVDEGRTRFERVVGSRPTLLERVRRGIAGEFALPAYLGTILFVSVVLAAGLIANAHGGGLPGWSLAPIGVLALLAASQLAAATANLLATLLAPPRTLSRMDFSDGIPPECRSLVVVPTLLTCSDDIKDLVEALEVRFLANQDDNLYFGLLTDFCDAHKETVDGDEELVQVATQQIEELNMKYGGPKSGPFFLFHRPRLWNPREKLWMGYERKRGKLAELNLLLRGESADGFSVVIGDVDILPSVKYVITLDTDTQLPRDSARQLAGAMTHPLNRPWYDEQKRRITKGYGILQPRVGVSLPGTNRSRYARLFGSDAGIDPYTRAVSDVYQDLYGEGSFTGKGIYDVDAFEQAIKGRFPENHILSHDTLEGCYARSGLLNDILLYEEHPVRYAEDVKRRHRWIRGDWQIIGWLLPGSPAPADVVRKIRYRYCPDGNSWTTSGEALSLQL